MSETGGGFFGRTMQAYPVVNGLCLLAAAGAVFGLSGESLARPLLLALVLATVLPWLYESLGPASDESAPQAAWALVGSALTAGFYLLVSTVLDPALSPELAAGASFVLTVVALYGGATLASRLLGWGRATQAV